MSNLLRQLAIFLAACIGVGMLLFGCTNTSAVEQILPPDHSAKVDEALFSDVRVDLPELDGANPISLLAESEYLVKASFRVRACDRTPRVRLVFARKAGDGEQLSQGGLALTRTSRGRTWLKWKLRTPRRPGLYEFRLVLSPSEVRNCPEATSAVIYSTEIKVLRKSLSADGVDKNKEMTNANKFILR